MFMKQYILILLVLAIGSLAGCSGPTYMAVGPNWQALYNAPEGVAAKVTLSPGKDAYVVGEKMTFTVKSDKAGKLWLITVGPDDVKRLIFPNSFALDNSIDADKPVRLPGEMESWSMKASEPLGKSLVVAIVTGKDARKEDVGEMLMSSEFSKSISLGREPIKYGMAKQVVNVER
jgi:Domain of unknown function (DUF4384)